MKAAVPGTPLFNLLPLVEWGGVERWLNEGTEPLFTKTMHGLKLWPSLSLLSRAGAE